MTFRNLYFFIFLFKLDSDENIREKLTRVLGTCILLFFFLNSYSRTRFRWEDTWESHVCFRYLDYFTFLFKLDSDENIREKLTWLLGTCIFLFFFLNLIQMRIYVRNSREFYELVFFYFFYSNSRTWFRWEDTWESHVSFRN